MPVSYFAVDLCGDCRCNRLLKFCETDVFSMFVLSGFCPGKWQALRNRDFASTYILNLKKTESQTYEVLKKASCVDTMSRTQHPEWYR